MKPHSNRWALWLTTFGAMAWVPAGYAQSPTVQPGFRAPVGVTAFVNVTVVPMDTERLLSGQTVVVEGGRIIALGPAKQVPVPAGAVRVDGRGKYLMPGLADMHIHLVDLSAVGIERQLLGFLANGVTTIRNMDHSASTGPLEQALEIRARIASGTLLGPRLYTSGRWAPCQYTNQPKRCTRGTPQVPLPRLDSIAAYVAAFKAAGYDFIKPYYEWRTQGPVFDSLLVVTRRLGIPMAGHVPNTVRDWPAARAAAADSLRRAAQPSDVPPAENAVNVVSPLSWILASGAYRSIEHMGGFEAFLLRGPTLTCSESEPTHCPPPGLDAAGIAAWERAQLDVARLPVLVAAAKRAGVWISPSLALWERRYFAVLRNRSESSYRSDDYVERGMVKTPMVAQFVNSPTVMDLRRKFLKAMQTGDSGVGVLLSSDGGMGDQASPSVVHHELAALARAGLTPYQALLTGTRNPAAYLGTLDSAGTVAVGKRADLLLLSGNPLLSLQPVREPIGVMLGGRWLDQEALDRSMTAPLEPMPRGLRTDQQMEAMPQRKFDWLYFEANNGLIYPSLPREGQDVLGKLVQGFTVKRTEDTTLSGMLLSAPEGEEKYRYLRQLAERFGALRAALTPEQRDAFDPTARRWLRARAKQGYRLAIAGITSTP
jgi:hypothetical protein